MSEVVDIKAAIDAMRDDKLLRPQVIAGRWGRWWLQPDGRMVWRRDDVPPKGAAR